MARRAIYDDVRRRYWGAFAIVTLLVTLAPVVAPRALADDDRDEEAALRGTLTAMSGTGVPATLTVQSGAKTYSVTVTDETRLVRKYNGRSALTEFAVGDRLRVRGDLDGTAMTAESIKNYSIRWRGVRGLWGTIESVDADAGRFTYTLKRHGLQTVTTDAETKVFQGNRAAEFGDLAVGMKVKVIGVWNRSAKTIAADRILIKLTTRTGKIVAIDAGAQTFELLVKRRRRETTYTVTTSSETIFHSRYFGLAHFDDLAVGHRVKVRGLTTGDTALEALVVWDKSHRKRFRSRKGSIASLDADAQTFVLDRKRGVDLTVHVVEGTVLVNKDGTVMTFADLVTGDSVQVWGIPSGADLTALLVRDKTIRDSWKVSLKGTIASLDADAQTFVLDRRKGDDLTIVVTAATTVVNKKKYAVAFGNLGVGDEVQVKGTRVRTEVTATYVRDRSLGSD